MRRILLALLPLLLVCGLLEVVLQSTHLFNARLSWTEPDREIGWGFTPGREYWFFAENDHAITGYINAMGWRDDERAAEKPRGTTRIAVLGDSYVEAFQVELDSTFVAIAGRALNARSGDAVYEVMNFGRSGMSPSEELLVLERDVLPCDADVDLLLFTPQNDPRDIDPATAADTSRPFFRRAGSDSLVLDTSFEYQRDFRIREAINPLKQHSALVSLMMERYNAWRRQGRAQRIAAPAGALDLSPEQRMCTAHPEPVLVENYALCKRLIERMHDICSSHGVRFVLAAVPLVYEHESVKRLRGIDPTFDPDYFDKDLAALADRRAFRFVPMRGVFEAYHRATGRALHWQHWNYDGHRLVATLVAPVISESAANASPDLD